MHALRIALATLLLTIASATLAGPVNVNTADAETLATELNGVGLSKARAIVAFRQEHGRFSSLSELAQVKGIGVRILELNQDNILLEEDAR